MIQTSQAFIDAVNQSSRQWRARFLYNGTDTGANTKTLTVKGGSQSETAFNLCGIYGASFEAVIDTLDGFKWEDKIITPQLGLVLEDESVEWISLGVFTITEVRSAKYQTTIIGVGNLTANGGKAFTLPATQSVNAIISAITSEIGVTITLDASFDGTTVIEKSMAGLSVQEALQVIASVLGGFVADKYDGSIMIAPYPTTPTTTIDTSRMTQEPTFADYDNQITGVHVIVSPAFVDEDGQTVPAVEYETQTYNITIENPYMTAEAFEDFADNITDLTWRPANVPIALGDPRYEATDMIEVNVNGEITQTYYVPCFNFVHHFDGGLQTIVIAYGDSESLAKTEQGGAITRQLKEIQGDILRVDRAIVQTLEVGDHFFVGEDGHIHITEEPKDYTTGNNVYIDADSVDIRQGTTMLASFGENTQIGETDNTHIEIDFNSLRLVDKEGNDYFVVEDLRNKQGLAQLVDTFEGDGITKEFYLSLPAENTNYTVTVNEVVSYPTKTAQKITFSEAPTENAQIVVTYKTNSWRAKAMHFGISAVGSKKGILSVSEGSYATASGNYSHAEGYSTTASGERSHAEGDGTIASGNYSHAEGNRTTASGRHSHAEGYRTTASATATHAEGYSTTASGRHSHAEGSYTTADGTGSHAQNIQTIANGGAQTALGKFNIADRTSAVIIGNGTDDNSRSNAVTIDWDGNVTIAGSYKLGKKNRGVRGLDSTDYEYPLICDNGTNLWIGASATASKHHTGGTVLSSGYDTANSKGFETITVSVPNATNTGATNYGVWHNGNLPVSVQNNVSEMAFNFSASGNPYLRWLVNGNYYQFLVHDGGALYEKYDGTTWTNIWRMSPNIYQAGESITFARFQNIFAGHITNGGKQIAFTIPLPRQTTGRTCTLTLLNDGLTVRAGTGGYVDGGDINVNTSAYTLTCVPCAVGVYVYVDKTSTYTGVANNTACSVQIQGTLTFS